MMEPPRIPLRHRLFASLRSRWKGVWGRSQIEKEIREEFDAHIQMRADDLEGQGVARREAVRTAHREFGHVETHRAEARAARGLGWIDRLTFSWVDVRLGLRMMRKFPGLTLVAAFALGVGIPAGLAPLHLSEALDRPLPEDSENRIRAIRFWNAATGVMEFPSYGDYTMLSEELQSFQQIGAYRNGSYSVGRSEASSVTVSGAEVTASALALLRVAPHVGRLLDVEDERPGSADVVLIGHRLWQTHFGEQPGIVGQVLRLGSVPHTVVGVMPEGFRFPYADDVWVPLRREASAMPGEGRTVRIVARLGDAASDEGSQAEIAALPLPPTHPAVRSTVPLELEVVPFSYTYVGLPRAGFSALPEFHFMRLLGWILLLVACANVAMLIFARTATRFRELAVRTALGAGRSRIVSQVFVETLVLATLACGCGLLLVDQIMERMPWELIAGRAFLPYWLDLGVPAGVLPSAVLLTVVSATVAGVIPAVRVTRGDIHQSIRSSDAGRSGIRFGKITGGLIVADVALAVGVIGFAFGVTGYLNELVDSQERVGIAADQYIAAELRLSANDLPAPDEGAEPIQRLARIQEVLGTRLGAEAEVRAVMFGDAMPRMNHRSRLVRVDGLVDGADDSGRWVRVARVSAGFFEQLGQPILTGRDFDRADTELEVRPVIVNTEFVARVLAGQSPIGRRVQLQGFSGGGDAAWHEVVGVVGRLGMNTVSRSGSPGLYLVEPAGLIHPLQVGIHVGPDPERFVPRLREIVAEVDPAVILEDPVVLSAVRQGDWYVAIGVVVGMGLLVSILVALAASGIYAMMSFSVSERTREIGIRSALGAGRITLVLTILRRAVAQLGIGGLLGIPLAVWFLTQIQDPDAGRLDVLVTVLKAAILGLGTVTLVGLLSCVIPARRALAVEANEALRAE